MFSRVLFPTDCSARARSLIALLAGLDPRPSQVCAAVVVPISGMEQPVIEEHLRSAKSSLESLVAPLTDAGIEVVTRVLTGRPTQTLLKTAAETHSDSILVGSYGKDPMEEVLRGSLSADLTRNSNLPIASMRFGALWDKDLDACTQIGAALYKRPLHPTDMSECSQRALMHLTTSWTGHIDRVDHVHVIDDVHQASAVHQRRVEDAHRYLDAWRVRLGDVDIDAASHLIEGDPVADSLRLAHELGSSCIVLGSHGKSLMREAVVGSVSQALLRMANVPVVVMH